MFRSDAHAPPPGAVVKAGTCANTSRARSTTFISATATTTPRVNYFTGDIQLAPSKYFRIGMRANGTTTWTAAAEMLNPYQVPGSLQSKIHHSVCGPGGQHCAAVVVAWRLESPCLRRVGSRGPGAARFPRRYFYPGSEVRVLTIGRAAADCARPLFCSLDRGIERNGFRRGKNNLAGGEGSS